MIRRKKKNQINLEKNKKETRREKRNESNKN